MESVVKMQSELLIFLLLIWPLAVISAPKKGLLTLTLGDKIFRKQEECESIISHTIDEIIKSEDSDLHDIPMPDESYYNCKDGLDVMKREYMKENQIDRSTHPEFFQVRLTEGSVEVSVPDEEGAEREETEFDLIEELCVTNRTCERLLDLREKSNGKEQLSTIRFAHCSVLLDDIKLKYIRRKGLIFKKLKDEGGLSVICTGKKVVMPLPSTINNLDFHQSSADISDTPMADSTHQTTTEASHAEELPNHIQEAHVHLTEHEKPGEQVQPTKETSKPVTGSKSNAFVETANLFYVTIVVVVLVAIM